MMYINGQAVAPTNLIKEGHNYSTDEQVVGTFIDGKPLYEKTFEIPQGNASTDYYIDISSLNLETMCEIDGYVDIGTAFLSINSIVVGAGTNTCYIDNAFQHSFPCIIYNFGWAFSGGAITLRYTKTTD